MRLIRIFSDIVKKLLYKKVMIKASNDRAYLEDMKEIEEDFRYSDYEDNSY